MNKIRKGDEVIVLAGATKASVARCRCARMTPIWSSKASTWSKAHQAQPHEGYDRRHR